MNEDKIRRRLTFEAIELFLKEDDGFAHYDCPGPLYTAMCERAGVTPRSNCDPCWTVFPKLRIFAMRTRHRTFYTSYRIKLDYMHCPCCFTYSLSAHEAAERLGFFEMLKAERKVDDD